MKTSAPSRDLLKLDCASEVERIIAAIRAQLRSLQRRGAVLGVSGGIDSSVTAALCARALGPAKTLALFMPEKDSESESLELGRLLSKTLGIESVLEDIGSQLSAARCYQRRDELIRKLVPDYGEGWGCKLVLPNRLDNKGYNLSDLVVQSPDGKEQRQRMPLDVYLGIVAATNIKQRTRKQIEYYHADRLNYAVAGTPNRLEYDQGFFVKNGDGAADFKPIAHLYKTQVYQLAAYLGIPRDITSRPPTTDTFSLAQSQEEFYFPLPYQQMDLCLFGYNNDLPAKKVAALSGLETQQVELIWRDIRAKRKTTRYLHEAALLVEPVDLTN